MILGLINDINTFVNNTSIDYFNDETTDLIDKAKANNKEIDEIAKEWEKLMREVRLFKLKCIKN